MACALLCIVTSQGLPHPSPNPCNTSHNHPHLPPPCCPHGLVWGLTPESVTLAREGWRGRTTRLADMAAQLEVWGVKRSRFSEVKCWLHFLVNKLIKWIHAAIIIMLFHSLNLLGVLKFSSWSHTRSFPSTQIFSCSVYLPIMSVTELY